MPFLLAWWLAWQLYSESVARLPGRAPARMRRSPEPPRKPARKRLSASLLLHRRGRRIWRRTHHIGLHLKLGVDERFALLYPSLRLVRYGVQLDIHRHGGDDAIQRADVAEKLANRVVPADDTELIP